MKKLLPLLTASLLVPMMSATAYASEKPTKIPKLSEYKAKGFERFTNKLPKSDGSKINVLGTDQNAGGYAVAKAKAAAQAQEFKCALISADNWTDEAGAYAFTGEADSEGYIGGFTKKYESGDITANGGGFFTEGKFYFTYGTRDSDGVDYDVNTYVVNTDTWKLERTFSQEDDGLYAMAYDLSYDPIEKVAFGDFYNGTESSAYWGYMDPSSGEITMISQLDGILVAVAINDNGEAYGITDGGYLVSIDKYSGTLTAIKGITTTTSSYLQSAAFAEDGTLYWSAVLPTDASSYGTGLVKIDVSTGAASLVGQYENYEYVAALYCEPAAADEGAPAEATNLKLNYTDDNLTGTVSFDVPSVDNQGASIEGEVTYIIYVDGEEKYTGKAAVGQTATVEVSVDNAGVHTIAVRLSNDKGNSRKVSNSQWIGIDRPVAVTNLTLVKDGNNAVLTWTAPEKGALGGYFDPARVNYTITRLSDNKVVASKYTETTFTDDLSGLTAPTYVTYSVRAYSDDAAGATATSDGAVFGPACKTPVSFTFDTEDDYNVFTKINANLNLNQDDGLWQYSPSGQCAGYVCGTLDGDDWLVTPDIELKADRQYVFSYDVLCYSNYWPDNYEVYLGTSATVAGMTTQLVPNTQIYWDEYRTNTLVVTVPEDGTYNFGFHALSEAGGAFFLVDNIKVVDSYKLDSPVAVSDLKAVAGEEGALNATVTFTTPTKTVGGDDLTELKSVKVLRDYSLVKEFANPAVGTQLSFEDTEDVEQGNIIYQVIASTEAGDGVEAEVTVYVGIDIPTEPTVHMKLDADSHPVISWDAPEGRGQNGGYVNAADLTYIVYRAADGTTLATGLTDKTYTDEDVEIDDQDAQSLLQYGVFAQNATGVGYPGTNFVISGEKYALPFKESVSNGTTDQLLLISTSVTGQDGYDNWHIDNGWNGTPQDSDGGELMVLPATPGVQSTIQMGKIDMTNAKNSELSFYLMRYDYENDFPETSPDADYVEVFVGGADYETTLVSTIYVKDMKAGKYTKYTVPLTEYEGTDFIFLQFKMNAVAAYYPVLLDNIQVRSNYDVNMQVSSVSAPSSVDVTNSFDVSVTVRNDGQKSVDAYTVTLATADGEALGTAESTSALAAEKTATHKFTVEASSAWPAEQTLVAKVVVANDENADDDSAEATVTIIRPEVSVITDLKVESSEETADFSWTAASIPTTQNVVESFEDYVNGAKTTGKVGNWTMIDVDKNWGMGVEDANAPDNTFWGYRAFTVFDPEDGEVGSVENYSAHTGTKSAIAFVNFEEENDDWMITPKLSGNAQTIKFWAKGINSSKDRLYFLYSTVSTLDTSVKGVNDFEECDLSYKKLTTEWKQYEVDVPQGATYFAFNYAVSGGTAALVDDVEFEQEAVFNVKPEVLGYNLYRDGEKVNDEVITTNSYTMAVVDGTYYVTVVYNTGESEASNEVIVSSTGVEDISVDVDDTDAPTYDTMGRRVKNLRNGQIYIRKGQKFIYRK